MAPGQTDPGKIQSALDDLAGKLATESFRDSLRNSKDEKSAKAAAKAAGVAVDDLPPKTLDTLRTLSHPELMVVSDVHQKLRASSPGTPKMAILF